MSRYQLIDAKTGEIVGEGDSKRAAHLAHMRRLWAYDDKRRGYVSSKRRQPRAHGWSSEEVLAGVLLGLLTLAYLLG